MKEKNNKDFKSNIVKMLRYAAAALSAVSFLTTLNGINGIITDSVWISGLISFGVQAIILVMGLWFIPAVKTIWKQNNMVFFKGVIVLFMTALYLCATVFSSFFSYVYMSNAAYTDVLPIDYNMELELFLVENTRTLRIYNNTIYDVLLKNIRQTAPEFQELMESYRQKANNEIKEILSGIPKYGIATIPTEMRFTADGAITAYEGANRTTADERLVKDCQRLEQQINQYITYYDNQYYPIYLQHYDNLMGLTDTVKAEARKAEIENVISSIEAQIDLLNGYDHIYGSVTAYIKSICNGIISQYNFLINALNALQDGYDEILAHPDVIQGEGLSLQSFYNVVYSADISTKEELDKARDNLRQVVSTYIQGSDEIDDGNVSALVECIEWLDKLNQCKELRDRIEQFESNNLTKTYIIISGNPQDNVTDDVQMNPLIEGIEQVEISAWNAARHADVTEFISLVKLIPDTNQILRQDVDKDDSAVIFLHEMEQDNYTSNALIEAYKYSRGKLEKISEIERAWNYMYSENNFLAIFCLFIAGFLDVASFLIGLYMYSCQEAVDKNANKTT